MVVAVKWNLHVLTVMPSVPQHVRTRILRQAMNSLATAPCSLVVIADLVILLIATVTGRDPPFTIGRGTMNFG
jgi:hypothetical protein